MGSNKCAHENVLEKTFAFRNIYIFDVFTTPAEDLPNEGQLDRCHSIVHGNILINRFSFNS